VAEELRLEKLLRERAQLIATKGWPDRGEPWWIEAGDHFLPGPDSPVMSTVVSEAVTRLTARRLFFQEGETR